MSSTDHATTDHASGTAPEGDVTGRSILLDEVTKRYPGQQKPAVDGITLEIPAGKVVMLVDGMYQAFFITEPLADACWHHRHKAKSPFGAY